MEPIKMTVILKGDIQFVWKVLTEKKLMIQWFFDCIPEFEAVEGFKTHFNIKSESRDFLHIWTVLTVHPPENLKVRWQYDGFEGDASVTYQLTPIQDERTQLLLTVQGLENFPQDVPEFHRESCEGGWRYFLEERLAPFCENYLRP